jgi:hypothetical protein
MVIGEPLATPAWNAKKAIPAIAAISTNAEMIRRPVLFPFMFLLLLFELMPGV